MFALSTRVLLPSLMNFCILCHSNFLFMTLFFYADRQKKRAIRVQTQPQTWHFLPVLVQPKIIKAEESGQENFHKPLTKNAGLMVQLMPDIKPDKSNTFEFFVDKVTAAIVFYLVFPLYAKNSL
ncbi:membrane protein [Beggiatoa sp. PS]|nr:membrane protein [Beggiatoa sp. PS]